MKSGLLVYWRRLQDGKRASSRAVEEGPDGFLVCAWDDGATWATEISNVDFPDMFSEPLLKKPSAATMKKPSAMKPCAMKKPSGDVPDGKKLKSDPAKLLYSRVYHKTVLDCTKKGMPKEQASLSVIGLTCVGTRREGVGA